ncbi:hypothetical protein Cus16_0564 [Curtobacterium sp. ER1/6]|nr:hypothetical protein Cus16_0564 [Curtobacterium sp. ER1/6]
MAEPVLVLEPGHHLHVAVVVEPVGHQVEPLLHGAAVRLLDAREVRGGPLRLRAVRRERRSGNAVRRHARQGSRPRGSPADAVELLAQASRSARVDLLDPPDPPEQVPAEVRVARPVLRRGPVHGGVVQQRVQPVDLTPARGRSVVDHHARDGLPAPPTPDPRLVRGEAVPLVVDDAADAPEEGLGPRREPVAAAEGQVVGVPRVDRVARRRPPG